MNRASPGVVGFESAGEVVTLTMDHQETRNALSVEMVGELAAGLERAVGTPGARVVVLTHAGPVFCSGADLRPGRAGAGVGVGDLAGLLGAVQDSPLPVVARIAGHCMGGGVGLAAACDLSVASSTARIGFTEVRLGVAPAVISVVCLPKLARADALELFLTGEPVLSSRAAEVGLITAAVAESELDATVSRYVAALCAGGPAALAAAKSLVYQVPGQPRAEAFAWTSRLSAELFAGAEGGEGRAAFAEKRAPSWRRPGVDPLKGRPPDAGSGAGGPPG